jgi:hypothetical protein
MACGAKFNRKQHRQFGIVERIDQHHEWLYAEQGCGNLRRVDWERVSNNLLREQV